MLRVIHLKKTLMDSILDHVNDPFTRLNNDRKDGVPISQPCDDGEYAKLQEEWGKDLRRFTFHTNVELQERLRNMSYWTRIPVTELGSYAIAKLIIDIEKEFNHEKPFKQRRQELKAGRPVGS